ncbi:glycosyltransferase family 2 protein [Sphaerotilus uruguayifluvii]|uniref:Glycosyltransferase involved in cell wall biosynthesis n=1 Tax=Sphaerotilus uruguayifluvii TaxID=2735897 RepID=A0ABX2G210_9BURK|nr:glycosyltransferase family 2 protein [Leptothrix sp. C29]NRT55464.1 glycosyltransferase involved in cell wall biosynthesis [Leptothrix sp. C29]
MHELISVVIPAYNAQHTLKATLESLFAQSWPALEIVVVDDGSTDGTAALLASMGSRVRAIRQPNGGLARARATGVGAARGQLIALLDADDLCRPDRLEIQAEVLRRLPEVMLCAGDFDAFDDRSGEILPDHARHYYALIGRSADGVRSLLPERSTLARQDGHLVPVSHGMAYATLAHGNFLHPPTLMFRRELLEQVGSFEDEARSMCDWDWIARAARVAPVAYVEHPLIDYRLSATQMSSPRHRVRATVDTLLVAERICQRDPEFYLQQLPVFLGGLGRFCIDAADALVETDRLEAARMLLRSATRFGRLDGSTLRVLLKILTPRWALSALRQRRGLPSPQSAG